MNELGAMPHDYLGDGLYVVLADGMLQLRANDFHKPSDTVYLEPSVLRNLVRFAENNAFI